MPLSARQTAAGILLGVTLALIIVAVAAQGNDGDGSGETTAALVSGVAQGSTPEATEPSGPLHVTAVGDSVMLAAIDALEADGIDVDAEVGRGVPAAIEVLRGIVERGELGDELLVHIGHNSVFTPEEVDEFMALADGRPTVFLTVNVPTKEWEAPNNQVMRDAVARYPNLRVLEWKDAVAGHPEYFWDDGIHLRPAGADFYVQFVEDALR